MIILKRTRTSFSRTYLLRLTLIIVRSFSLRNTSQRLLPVIKRNHVSIWNWIQRYRPMKIMQTIKRIAEYIIDKILIKAGHKYMWLWIICY
jgi:putative transposase